ncbi:hypothetical protein QYF61_016796 [Mycteria americana]|uniref:Uncharacterized protein n=1 Tax=Mycteria americana TaxID=33587 RepID=A0AAN7PHG9_MYCAM|nr:hypothetical protein QYF61_016796 [Mycteria americana]
MTDGSEPSGATKLVRAGAWAVQGEAESWVAVESDEVSPQPPFLQAEQPQVPQPLPISLVLQTLPQLRCPSLDTLQPLNVSLVVGGPTLNTVFELLSVISYEQWDEPPSPSSDTCGEVASNSMQVCLVSAEQRRAS